MEAFSVYKDMQSRTNGEIYIGVVGPVRTGKSTFIKKFMDTTVIPNIEDEAARDRAVDELPQSASGRTIMEWLLWMASRVETPGRMALAPPEYPAK